MNKVIADGECIDKGTGKRQSHQKCTGLLRNGNPSVLDQEPELRRKSELLNL